MGLFGKKKGTSVALLDVDNSSVGGALAHIQDSVPPSIYYASRTDIVPHQGENQEHAVIRAVQEKLHELVRNGGPILRRDTGSGHSDSLFIRVGTPWQLTNVRRERITDAKSFTFTRAMEREVLRKNVHIPENYQNSEEAVVATLLNGYDTPNPYGKQAKQAELVVLSSWIEKNMASAITRAARSAFHSHSMVLATATSISYSVFRNLFPLERNYLVLEISAESSELLYIKNNIIVQISVLPNGFNDILRTARTGLTGDDSEGVVTMQLLDPAKNARFSKAVERAEKEWLEKLQKLFQELAAEQALPRTIFIVAPDDAREYLSRLIDTPELHALWLSDEPLRIIGFSTTHLASYVSTGPEAEQDTFLGLMALYAARTIHTQAQKS